MGSTIAVLHCCGGNFAILWAGDSRIYLQRDGALYRLTTDHSQVQEMIEAGLISEDEASTHPRRSVLTRAVGVAPALQLDAIVDQLEDGDTFLLCSDGLSTHLSDEEIGQIMDSRLPAEMAASLVRLALDRGGKDNVTVVAVACQPLLQSATMV